MQALERIQETEYNDIFPITFDQREEALEFDDVIENLRDLMDIAFKSVMGQETYDEDDEDYQKAKELFINEDGIPYGAVMYGLFLNLYVANVFTIHPSIKHASGAVFENVHIHDLNHKVCDSVTLLFCERDYFLVKIALFIGICGFVEKTRFWKKCWFLVKMLRFLVKIDS